MCFSSKLDCTPTMSLLLRLPLRKLKPWFITFFLSTLSFISKNLPSDLAWNVWAGAPNCYLDIFEKLQKALAYCQTMASLSLFYRYYFERCSFCLSQMDWFIFFILVEDSFTFLKGCMIFLSPELNCMFFTALARL